MMPRPLSNVLRRTISGIALATLIISCCFWLARSVLAPLWPAPVSEVLAIAEEGASSERWLTGEIEEGLAQDRRLARNRPISLWRVELRTGEIVHAWLQGIRAPDGGALLTPLPGWVESVRVDEPTPVAGQLVLLGPDRQRREVPLVEVERMYRPNGMRLGERLALARDRLRERWRWPFSRTPVDARTTPPGR